MNKVLIFSGTTEGKRLAVTLSDNHIPCVVCVATEYGQYVMPSLPDVRIHQGRMDAAQMTAFMQEEAFCAVVDATHPFAVEVSKNIRESAGIGKLPYLRLKRDTGITADESVEAAQTIRVRDAKECAELLSKTEGNILLTTGSKELSVYSQNQALLSRLFVRVLPGVESISLCEKAGIFGKQIIAMQGPFSLELNRALIQQFQIRHLVTKESGRAGGMLEKLQAAEQEGITGYVIGNPEKEEEGLTFFEVCKSLSKLCHITIKNQVFLMGLGMGSEDSRTLSVKKELEEADYLFGAKRLLDSVSVTAKKYPYYLKQDILPVLEELSGSGARIGVVFSGDTGFFSGCSKLYEALLERTDCNTVILPGLSSVSYLAAGTGYSWQDGAIVSIHGHGEGEQWCAELLEKVRHTEKTYLLTSGIADVRLVGRYLRQSGLAHCRILTGCQLSYPEESIESLTPEECEQLEEKRKENPEEKLYTCLILNPRYQEKLTVPGFPDSSFCRDKVPMTKEEIRSLSLCKLRLTEKCVCYDIGSGTGSIAIEMAKRSGKSKVYAIERKETALQLLQKNKEVFSAYNMEIVAGEAPECLEELPPATHAFIGGSNDRFSEILDVLYRKNPRMRVVVNAVSLETMAELKTLKSEERIGELDIIQVQVSRAKPLGAYQLMQAENPIMIAAFTFVEVPKDSSQTDKGQKEKRT